MTKSNNSTRQTGSAAGTNTVAKSSVPARQVLLAIGFIEGAAVMVIELLGAKIIAPFYGTSLYVWSSVLGVTLAALATGYYFGGYLSEKYRTATPLFLVLGVGALLTLLAPRIAPTVMQMTAGLGVRTGSFVSVFIYLLPPIVCMGTVSPLITQLINGAKDNAGKSAGTVYAISTVGGILATFLAGFYLIPELGISLTSILTSVVLGAIALLGLVRQRRFTPAAGLLLIGLASATVGAQSITERAGVTIQHQSSGILGEWTVVDQVAMYDDNGEPISTRRLLLNGIDQTYTEVGNEPVSLWLYPHKIAALAGIKPAGSKVLLLGMGGGSMVHNLLELGFDLDVLELDGRIPDIAETYFNFDPASAHLIIDDARHYINETDQQYDLVLFDMVSGEVQPWHIFTIEGLKRVREIVRDDALIIVNFQGLYDVKDQEQSLGPRSVYKTFQAAGFDVHISRRSEESDNDLASDLLIYGSPGALDFESAFQQKLRYDELFPFETFTGSMFTPVPNVELEDALVLTDDKPNLEQLNAPTILQWRTNKMEFVTEMLEKGLSIFE